MQDNQRLLAFAEQYIQRYTDKELTGVQRIILSEAFNDGAKRKTYDQIASDTGYSNKYLKQVVGPQLWQFLAEIIGQKVTKFNVRLLFLEQYQSNNFEASLSTPSKSTVAPPPSISSASSLADTTDEGLPTDRNEAPPTATRAENISMGKTPAMSFPEHVAPPASVESIRPPDGQFKDSFDESSSESGVLLALSGPSDTEDSPVILLVDDQPQNIALLSEILENDGYEVRQAIDGELALQSAFMDPPDLILLDINMPGMNGYEVCTKLKADSRTEMIPVIFISALSEMWDKIQAFSVGGSDYITKPFKAMEVIARIENQLKTGRLYDQLYKLMAKAQYGELIMQTMQVLDPGMGLATRSYFDSMLQRCWQQSLENQTTISLILCRFHPAPDPDMSDSDDPYELATPLPQRIVVSYPLLSNVLLTIINPVNGLATAYDDNTVAIVFVNMGGHPHQAIVPPPLEDIAQQIQDGLEAHLQAMNLTLNLSHVSTVAQENSSWTSFIEQVEQAL